MMRTKQPVSRFEFGEQRVVTRIAGRRFRALARLKLDRHLAVAKLDAERLGECGAMAAPCLRLGLQTVIDMNGEYRNVGTGQRMRQHGRIEATTESNDVSRWPIGLIL